VTIPSSVTSIGDYAFNSCVAWPASCSPAASPASGMLRSRGALA
jgi:hypothetical protein